MIIQDNFSYFSMKPYVVTPHLNGSDEQSQHMFLTRINKNYPQISPNTPSLSGTFISKIMLIYILELPVNYHFSTKIKPREIA